MTCNNDDANTYCYKADAEARANFFKCDGLRFNDTLNLLEAMFDDATLFNACNNDEANTYCSPSDAEARAVTLGCSGSHQDSEGHRPCNNGAYLSRACNKHDINSYCYIEDAQERAITLGCNGTHLDSERVFSSHVTMLLRLRRCVLTTLT